MSGIRPAAILAPRNAARHNSTETGEKAICAAGIDRRRIGALIHGSVCRDFLEPATACGVHHCLDLGADCAVYDVSNACLGLLNGVVQVANAIELGQIEAGLIVGTESSRDLVESTIRRLNADDSLSRDQDQARLRFPDHRLGQRRDRVGQSTPEPDRQPPVGRRRSRLHASSAIFAKAATSRPPTAICKP